MKKSILFALLACISICTHATSPIPGDASQPESTQSESTYTPLVVEGRTWWYTAEYLNVFDVPGSYDTETGVRIGSEVEIDGEKWYNVYLYMKWDTNKSEIKTFNEDDEFVHAGYIREKDNVVECRDFENGNTFYIGDGYIFNTRNCTATIYSFKEDSFRLGSDLSNVELVKKHEYTAENSGRTYRYIVREAKTTTDSYYYGWIKEFTEVEGIGVIETVVISVQFIDFYSPFGSSYMSTGHHNQYLRYVTDADNNIIFEHLGGLKLWEIAEGVNDITVDNEQYPEEWYNLQGERVDGSNLAPGIYIRRTGSTAERVLVK